MLLPLGDTSYKIIVSLSLLAVSGAFVNIALNKPAYQSRVWHDEDAQNAVDGRKSNQTWKAGECSKTYGDQNATWWANLTSIHIIHHIVVYYMKYYRHWGSVGSSVYVSNTTNISDGFMCFNDSNYSVFTVPAIVNISCSTKAQYVIYYNEIRPGVKYPEYKSTYAKNMLCEVEVYGCPNTGLYYGADCCSNVNCRYCYMETGTCLDCKPGYKGDMCELECTNGKYGEHCQIDCGHCRYVSQCNHVNGTCVNGCKSGYKQPTCTQKCEIGSYGVDCSETCGHCLDVRQCSNSNGICRNGCDAGYQGAICKIQCTSGKYGKDCQLDCGHCKNMMQCHHVDGTCVTGCEPGFIGDTCKTVCDKGWYGDQCREQCGHCRDTNQCLHTNGTCITGCMTGYYGDLCKTQCTYMKYGDGCQTDCGHCKDMVQCNHVDGACLNGCEPGYTQDNCTQHCEIGTYGVDCNVTCGHCRDLTKCSYTNGTCFTGCIAGYQGALCKTVDELSRRTLLFFIFSLCSILGLTWICWIISTICNKRQRCGQQKILQSEQKLQAEGEQLARIYDDTKCKSPLENQMYFNVPEDNTDNTYVEMKHIYQN
ncbi:protein draper-like [Crassostrea angulata]|uniref:protein draper-like n=1 Tax=Magallana angulata TaxID=2784310 RepID=UPI0022B13E4C|nr:protein draper-like [Crassostrea angulata]